MDIGNLYGYKSIDLYQILVVHTEVAYGIFLKFKSILVYTYVLRAIQSGYTTLNHHAMVTLRAVYSQTLA